MATPALSSDPSSQSDRAVSAASGSKPGIEVRSIDYIPHAERHGKIWHLAPVWVAGNANVATVAVGAVGVAAGASLFWTMVAVLAGCSFGTIFAALHSTQGPHLGLPQLIQSRPQFGYFGALAVFALALANYVGFNVFCNVLAGESLQVTTHLPTKLSFVVASVVAGVIALVGYDSIHRVSRWLTSTFTVVFVILTVVVLTNAGLTPHSFAPGHFTATAFLLQFGAVAGYQITWGVYVSDYTRYLPTNVKGRRMFWCTYLGMTVSAVWLAWLGALLATAFSELDAVGAVQAAGDMLMPGFGSLAILIALAGLITVMAMNTYGGALTLISIVDCLSTVHFTRTLRVIAVSVVTIVALALSFAASSNFLTDFGAFLTVLLYLFAPWTAINLTDYFLIRRGHYSIREIFNPHGLYGRWNARGLLAYAFGFAAELPFHNTAFYSGPIARSLSGADLSPFVGLLVGALAYWLLNRNIDLAAEKRHISTADQELEVAARSLRGSGELH